MSKQLPHQVGEYDVLYGRGGLTNKHKGNIYFRHLIFAYQPQYRQSRRAFKPKIADMIVQMVRSRGGRFLKLDEDDLVEVSDEMAVTKTLQALRDTVVPKNLPEDYNHNASNALPDLRMAATHHKSLAGARSHKERGKQTKPNEIIYANNTTHVPNFYPQAHDVASLPYPTDAGRQLSYDRNPPPDLQPRLQLKTPYPTESNTVSSFARPMGHPLLHPPQV